MPIVAPNIPTVFGEKLWNKYRLTVPRTPSSVRATDGITAITQKNNAAIKNPSARGTSTFIHRSKNKYCAVKTLNLSSDRHKTVICLPVVTLFNSLP